MFRRLNLNSISFGNRKSYRLKEKLASTLAAVALACGCAASLSACGNKNNAAKSIASSASESTTSESQKATEDEVDDAGLNFKTIYSDALKMNISVPENAEHTGSHTFGDDDSSPVHASIEAYIWEEDGLYYQYDITRSFYDTCPEYLLNEYNSYVEKYESDSADVESEMVANTVVVYDTDWSASAATKVDGGCTIIANVNASEKLGKPDEINSKAIDRYYYDNNGIDDAKRKQMRPVIRAVMKKAIESLNAAKSL